MAGRANALPRITRLDLREFRDGLWSESRHSATSQDCAAQDPAGSFHSLTSMLLSLLDKSSSMFTRVKKVFALAIETPAHTRTASKLFGSFGASGQGDTVSCRLLRNI